jgi:hypothetical protein
MCQITRAENYGQAPEATPLSNKIGKAYSNKIGRPTLWSTLTFQGVLHATSRWSLLHWPDTMSFLRLGPFLL